MIPGNLTRFKTVFTCIQYARILDTRMPGYQNTRILETRVL